MTQTLFTEIFPLEASAIPRLTAYRLAAETADIGPVGRAVMQHAQHELGGGWAWVDDRLVTDSPPNPMKLVMVTDAIVAEQVGVFGAVTGVEEDYDWQPRPTALAEFLIQVRLAHLHPTIDAALTQTAQRRGGARLERSYRGIAWAVNGQAALSFAVRSQLIYDPDLRQYMTVYDDLAQLTGLHVLEKQLKVVGVITGLAGTVAEHRDRLMELTQRDWMRDLLKHAPDDEPVVRVSLGRREYDFPVSALRVPVSLDDPHRFEIEPARPPVDLSLPPETRAGLVKIVADIVKADGLIGDAFSTKNEPERFRQADEPVEIVLGNNRTRPYEPKQLLDDFSSYGAYWWRDRFQSEPIRIGIINTFSAPTNDFIEAMQRVIASDFQFSLEVVRERKVRVISQSNLESAVRVLAKEPIDLLLAFFRDPTDDREEDEADDDFIKAQTVGRGIPCVIIHEQTFNNPDAMPGIIMGMLARAGNVPYLLDAPLGFTDMVVGLDLIYEPKRDGLHLTGMVRVYRNDGALLYYALTSAPVQPGEGIPEPVLAYLFAAENFRDQRVVIHCNGALQPAARQALANWEEAIDAVFYPVTITQADVPHLYALHGRQIAAAPAGTIFRLNDSEALVVTAAVTSTIPPQPLHLHIEPPLTIEEAMRSLVTFTRLHYGRPEPLPLPVTLHNAEYIRASIARGILPDPPDGNLPFWL